MIKFLTHGYLVSLIPTRPPKNRNFMGFSLALVPNSSSKRSGLLGANINKEKSINNYIFLLTIYHRERNSSLTNKMT